MNEPVTFDYLARSMNWPFSPPKVLSDLTHLEAVFDVLDAYKWLAYVSCLLFFSLLCEFAIPIVGRALTLSGVVLLLCKCQQTSDHGKSENDQQSFQSKKSQINMSSFFVARQIP